MSECYVCGKHFEKAPVVKGRVPMCVTCQPRSDKTTEAKASETLSVPPIRRYHVRYVQAGRSLPEKDYGIIEEKALRVMLWDHKRADLSQSGNAPHINLPGNVFWQPVTDDPKATVKFKWSID